MGKIINQNLPHDLPENWTDNQYVTPGGTEAGLSEQHGFNYLMKQVNNAQKAIQELDAGSVNKNGDTMTKALCFKDMAFVDGVETDIFHAAILKALNMGDRGDTALVVFCQDSHVGGEAYIQHTNPEGAVIASHKVIHTGNLSTITPESIGAVSREEWAAGLVPASVE